MCYHNIYKICFLFLVITFAARDNSFQKPLEIQSLLEDPNFQHIVKFVDFIQAYAASS